MHDELKNRITGFHDQLSEMENYLSIAESWSWNPVILFFRKLVVESGNSVFQFDQLSEMENYLSIAEKRAELQRLEQEAGERVKAPLPGPGDRPPTERPESL